MSKMKISETSALTPPDAEPTTAPMLTTVPKLAARGVEQVASGTAETVTHMQGAGREQVAQAQAKVKETMEKTMNTAEEMMQFGQGNVEAWVRSGQILAAGLQDMGKRFAATAQANFAETMSTLKAMTSARSVKEAFEMQASLTRAAMEKAMAETGRMTEASFKLAEQSAAPIAARLSLAVEKFGRAA